MPRLIFRLKRIWSAENAIDVVGRQIVALRFQRDLRPRSRLNEKEKSITISGIPISSSTRSGHPFPAMEKKEKEKVKRLDHQTVQKISGNKVKGAENQDRHRIRAGKEKLSRCSRIQDEGSGGNPGGCRARDRCQA